MQKMMYFPPAVQILRRFADLPGDETEGHCKDEHFQEIDHLLRNEKLEGHFFVDKTGGIRQAEPATVKRTSTPFSSVAKPPRMRSRAPGRTWLK